MAIKKCLPLLLLCNFLLAAPLQARDDVQEKINLLEQQLQELKVLKAQQDIGKKKAEQCWRAVGQDKFCSCIGMKLPADINFEQYIHTTMSSREELGYNSMSPEQKQGVDTLMGIREKCVENGFFE